MLQCSSRKVGRVFDKAQQAAEARLAKLKAEVAELEKRQGARSQDTLLLDPDIMQLSSGRVVCKVCTENRASLVHLTMQRSLWLSVNGGVNLDYNTTAKFRKHKGEKNHQVCACAAAAAELDPIPFKGVDGDSAESSSKVIKRMLKEKSPTFLFKGPPEN